MTWYEEAVAIMAEVDAALPAGTTLADRKRAILAAKPNHFATTSWGSKTWGKARREYLAKHGDKPLPSPMRKPHLSPLERMMTRSRPNR